MIHTIEEAIEDLKAGKMILAVDDDDRENEGDLIVLAEHATPEIINFMATYGRGLICMPLTHELADKLQLHPMVANNTDNHETAFTVSIDHKDTDTGISAYERSHTVLELLKSGASPEDFRRPGHVFPLIAKSNGVIERMGHTEAAVDLAKICGSAPVAVICEVMKDDGTMARLPDLEIFAEKHQLKLITIADLIRYRNKHENFVKREANAKLPTSYGNFNIIGYSNKVDYHEHIALVKGEWKADEPVLVRIHSECLTGDVFHSKRCDCGVQLQRALKQIEDEGAGVVLYMRQEGRGIGLINKLRAYELQEEGFDTIEANEQLGFPAELRDYTMSAHILKELGINKVRLMTNNPEKIYALADYDIEVVERVPIQVKAVEENMYYLETKKMKMGHLLA